MSKQRMLPVLALAVLLLGQETSALAQKPPQTAPCCFNNPRYSGTCVVEPAAETCASVLAYLNNPQAAGKTYCGNTTIRGGWKAVRCKPVAK